MKEYMMRLVQNHPDAVGDWELKFKEQEDGNAVESGAHILSIIGTSYYVTGAMLFYLQPSGTIKEYVHIYSFMVARNVVVKKYEGFEKRG